MTRNMTATTSAPRILLAYIGDEPVGCLQAALLRRLREVRAHGDPQGIPQDPRRDPAGQRRAQILPEKGLSPRLWPFQSRLVTFWSRFGFRRHGRRASRSSFPISTMSKSSPTLERDPDAITIGDDPYVVIRPEGRWHVPASWSSPQSSGSPAILPPRETMNSNEQGDARNLRLPDDKSYL